VILSIIIPAYNVEKFICKNIESIICMRNDNIELIIVDDGSTDNTYEICKDYASKYDFIKVITEKNGGPGKARNTGVSVATGEWIFFVDADDYIISDGLNRIIDHLQNPEFNGDTVVFNTLSYFESTGDYSVFTGSFLYNNCQNGSCGSSFWKEVLRKDVSYGYCAVFYAIKKKLLIDNNIRFFDEGTSNDICFSIQIWNKAKAVYYFDEDVYVYRRDQPNSITHNPNIKWMSWVKNRIIWNLNYINYDVEDIVFKDYLVLSNFNLYLVILSCATRVKDDSIYGLLKELEDIKDKFCLTNYRVLKSVSRKIKLTYLFNSFFSPFFFWICWKIYRLFEP